MQNEISLTIRIPEKLNNKLKLQSHKLGFTKTGMIKLAIYRFLKEIPTDLSTVDVEPYKGKTFRLVLNLNEFLNELLVEFSNTYGLSVNSVVTRVCILTSLYYEELLIKLGFDD